jgi:hypothetical protein
MIMKPTTEKLVDDYLEQLDSELADLPRLRRKEIVEEISEHIAEARAAVFVAGGGGDSNASRSARRPRRNRR